MVEPIMYLAIGFLVDDAIIFLENCVRRMEHGEAPLVAALEAELGVPIYDTIAVVVWKALRMAGVATAPITGWGRLFGYQQ